MRKTALGAFATIVFILFGIILELAGFQTANVIIAIIALLAFVFWMMCNETGIFSANKTADADAESRSFTPDSVKRHPVLLFAIGIISHLGVLGAAYGISQIISTSITIQIEAAVALGMVDILLLGLHEVAPSNTRAKGAETWQEWNEAQDKKNSICTFVGWAVNLVAGIAFALMASMSLFTFVAIFFLVFLPFGLLSHLADICFPYDVAYREKEHSGK